jgi:hypothetical protein
MTQGQKAMHTRLLHTHRGWLAVTGICLAAAAGASGPPAKTNAANKATVTATASAKANGSGVVLRYTVPQRIALGETVVVRLAFAGVSAADGAAVEVTESEGGRVLLALRLAQGEQREVDLSYTGQVDGMQYLNVATSQNGRMTVQSVPLAVGSGKMALKQGGTRIVTPSGEAVISMPANK